MAKLVRRPERDVDVHGGAQAAWRKHAEGTKQVVKQTPTLGVKRGLLARSPPNIQTNRTCIASELTAGVANQS